MGECGGWRALPPVITASRHPHDDDHGDSEGEGGLPVTATARAPIQGVEKPPPDGGGLTLLA